MTFNNPWAAPGRFVKAHLHTHTTESDGKLAPDAVAWGHFQCGYSVLAITDHGKVTETSQFQREGMITLPGVEIGCSGPDGAWYHVVALGIGADAVPGADTAVAEALVRIHEAGGLAFIAHPYWSCNTVADLLGLEHCIGIEVYNHGCEAEIAKGLSSVHWDDCLRRGERYLPLAVDDAHMYGYDFLGGWTMIRVAELTREAVYQALREGLFYATMGPEILDLRIEGSVIVVETSPAQAIRFVANDQHGWCEGAWSRPPLTSARYQIRGNERYVRVEIIDQAGRRAWAPPVWLT